MAGHLAARQKAETGQGQAALNELATAIAVHSHQTAESLRFSWAARAHHAPESTEAARSPRVSGARLAHRIGDRDRRGDEPEILDGVADLLVVGVHNPRKMPDPVDFSSGCVSAANDATVRMTASTTASPISRKGTSVEDGWRESS